MGNFDREMMLVIAILFAIFYLFNRSLLQFRKLTRFQYQNRWNIINRQGIILVCLLAFSWGYNYLLDNYIYQFFVNFLPKNSFILYGFMVLVIVMLFLYFNFNSYINSKDERVVNIEQEATFVKFKPKRREVKPIKFYSHLFNGISLERSPKDYTIQSVKLNIDLNELKKYKIEQEEKAIEINDFYKRLIKYINSKAYIFNYSKIEHFELQECNNMLNLKILIFKRFENLTKKEYFASISQLYQISNNDETQFLSFLRDSQHYRFSSTALKHAALFLKIGVLK